MIFIKKKGNTTMTLGRDTHKRLMFLKIKTQAKNLDEVLRKLIKQNRG